MVTTLLLVLVVIGLLGLVFRLGVRFGSDRGQSELSQLRWDTVRAKRQMHDLTRQAFVAMAQEAQRQGPLSGDGLDHQR